MSYEKSKKRRSIDSIVFHIEKKRMQTITVISLEIKIINPTKRKNQK
ncbi:hypothetical protein [Lactococcus lactis]